MTRFFSNRRRFLTLATTTALLSAMPPSRWHQAGGLAQADPAPTNRPDASSVLKPNRLRPGQTVGIISPASATFLPEQLDIVQDAVRGLGLVPRVAPHALSRYGYLAGRDRDRADDINQFFADPSIAALLPIQGGWGSSRLLPYLDYDRIRQNPKILVGFSDLTALTLGIHARTGLVTFHGPNGLTAWRSPQVASFRQVLFEAGQSQIQSDWAAEDRDRLMQVKHRIQTITPGTAVGPLIGGNLSVLAGIVGSPYMPPMEGAILFLEDIGESIYRIDRMLTHLKLAGVLDGIAGFIFGQCPNCTPGSGYGSLTLADVLRDHIAPLGVPAWSGALIGHVEPVLTLPIGTTVTMEAESGTIHMAEAAVM